MVSKTNPEHRVGIFIDVQNLYHSAKNLRSSRVNYHALTERLLSGRRLVRAFAYVVTSDPQTGEDAFFGVLEKEGLELRSKDLQIYQNGVKKADWDVGLAVDVMRLARDLDVIIIATGDGDFIPLVEYLRIGLGKIVEIAAFDRTTSQKLKESADAFIDIEMIPRSVFKTSKSRKNKSTN